MYEFNWQIAFKVQIVGFDPTRLHIFFIFTSIIIRNMTDEIVTIILKQIVNYFYV